MKFVNAEVSLEGALEGATPTRLWKRHMKDLWWVYSAGILAVLTTDAIEVLIPKLIQWTIDGVTNRSPRLHTYIWIFTGFLLAQFIARIAWRQTLAQQTHRVAAKMKSVLWDRARFFPRARLDTDLSPGELMNVATGDVGTARMLFGFTMVGTIDFIFLTIFTILAMLGIDWQLTLLSLIILPLLPFLLDKLSRKESEQHEAAQQSLSALTDLAAQAVATIRLQRLTQSAAHWKAKLDQSAADYRQKRFDVVATSLNFIPITGFAPLVSYGILVGIGVHKVLHGQMTLGGFVAMQSFIFMIQGPLLELGTIVSEWQRCFASLRRFTFIMQQPEEANLRTGGILPVARNKIFEVKNLSFAYSEQSREILHAVSFELSRGDRLGIKGPIGSGKSTLLNLLAGFDRNFSGELKFFGDDIRAYSHRGLTQYMSFIPQRSFLFADSIRNNLRIDREVTDDELWTFLEIAGLKDDVSRFPEKLDTRLGEWGVNLSGGQKQRMTLARALARRPQVLLLDDCLSAVDTVTEDQILRGLDEHLRGTTLLWVAHRDSTLRYCNKILELPA